MQHDLTETLRAAQRFGFFGAQPIEEAIEHSRQFVAAIGDLPPQTRLVDLGSGGGLPGLVVADAYRSCAITLLDRRQKRTDFLHLAVARHGWSHVTVATSDVSVLIDDVRAHRLDPFEVVTARGFGPPEFTLRSAVSVSVDDARIVISEPPTDERWPESLLVELSLRRRRHGAVSVFTNRRAAGMGDASAVVSRETRCDQGG